MDLCGGMSRCSPILTGLFDTVDVCDLKPSFGDTPPGKRGRLITSNLKDIGEHIQFQKYSCIYGNWALCYLGYQEMVQVLIVLRMSIYDNGSMILKEPILNEGESTPRLCRTGQWLLTRSADEIERHLLDNFFILKRQDLTQVRGVDRQRIWYLKGRPIVSPLRKPTCSVKHVYHMAKYWYCLQNQVHEQCQHEECTMRNHSIKTLK